MISTNYNQFINYQFNTGIDFHYLFDFQPMSLDNQYIQMH
jgi:hypothetical protein